MSRPAATRLKIIPKRGPGCAAREGRVRRGPGRAARKAASGAETAASRFPRYT
jgi:hypothetical protein